MTKKKSELLSGFWERLLCLSQGACRHRCQDGLGTVYSGCEARVQATGLPGVYYLACGVASEWRSSCQSCCYQLDSVAASFWWHQQHLLEEMEEEVPYYKDYTVLDSLQIIQRLNQAFFRQMPLEVWLLPSLWLQSSLHMPFLIGCNPVAVFTFFIIKTFIFKHLFKS